MTRYVWLRGEQQVLRVCGLMVLCVAAANCQTLLVVGTYTQSYSDRKWGQVLLAWMKIQHNSFLERKVKKMYMKGNDLILETVY